MVNWQQRVVAGLVLLAAVAAILTVGYALGKDHNEALLHFLREKNQMLEASEKTLRAEIEVLKRELTRNRQPQTASASTLVDIQTPPIGNPDPKTSLDETPEEGKSQLVSVSQGTTAQLFEGAILITFQAVQFAGNPPRYSVDAILGKVGKTSKEVQGLAPGQALIYEGFEVRLMEINSLFAKFLVTRL